MKNLFLALAIAAVCFSGCKKEKQPAAACFTADNLTQRATRAIHFSNCSVNAETYSWDFGDGTSSALSSPSHSYNSSGNYTVILTAIGNSSASTTNHNVVIKDLFEGQYSDNAGAYVIITPLGGGNYTLHNPGQSGSICSCGVDVGGTLSGQTLNYSGTVPYTGGGVISGSIDYINDSTIVDNSFYNGSFPRSDTLVFLHY